MSPRLRATSSGTWNCTEGCENTTTQSVIGCVHAAHQALHDRGHHCRYDDVESVWLKYRKDLGPLVGTEKVWQELAEKFIADTTTQPRLFG